MHESVEEGSASKGAPTLELDYSDSFESSGALESTHNSGASTRGQGAGDRFCYSSKVLCMVGDLT